MDLFICFFSCLFIKRIYFFFLYNFAFGYFNEKGNFEIRIRDPVSLLPGGVWHSGLECSAPWSEGCWFKSPGNSWPGVFKLKKVGYSAYNRLLHKYTIWLFSHKLMDRNIQNILTSIQTCHLDHTAFFCCLYSCMPDWLHAQPQVTMYITAHRRYVGIVRSRCPYMRRAVV